MTPTDYRSQVTAELAASAAARENAAGQHADLRVIERAARSHLANLAERAAARAASGLQEGDVVMVKAGWERGRTATITGVNTQTGAWLVALDSGMPGTFWSDNLERAAATLAA